MINMQSKNLFMLDKMGEYRVLAELWEPIAFLSMLDKMGLLWTIKSY